jgi:hypothetical protein
MNKWLKMLEVVGPIALAATPLAPIAPAVVAAMHNAEKIPGATGEEKKAAVKSIIRSSANAANTQAGKIVIDPQEAVDTADNAIDTTVHAVNLARSVNDAS